jgi:hypothetical protein
MVTFLKLEITMNGITNMSLEDVKKAYRTVHTSIKQNHTRDRRNEAALFTRNGAVTLGQGYAKVFKGDCRTCGQKDHKSANCWENPTNKDKRSPNWKSKNTSKAALMTISNDINHCDYCHKYGNTEDRCYKKKWDSGSATVRRFNLTETVLSIYETALMVRAIESGYVNDTTFAADTGATSHIVNSTNYLTDITQISSQITMGNEDLFQCTEKGIYRGFFKNKHEKDIPSVLQDVLHVPWIAVKLLSLLNALQNKEFNFHLITKICF